MPTLEENVSVKQLAKEAKEHFEAIKKAGIAQSVSSLTIGFHAQWIKKHNQFGALGFSSEDEARQAAGVGESTWYSVIRLAESFEGLTEKQFTSMKLTNAKKATDLPLSKRLDSMWVRSAEVDSIEKFAAKVDEEMHGKAKPSDTKERSTALKYTMPESRKTFVEAGLKEYAEAIGVEDTGKALEFLVAERKGGVTLIGAITSHVERFREAQKLKASDLSLEEVVEKVFKLLEDSIVDFDAAIASVQNLDSQPQQ